MLKKYSSYPYFIWSVVFILLPIFLVVYYSFVVRDASGISLSFRGYQTFFEARYIEVFLKSILFAFISTAFCFVIGYPLAYYISTKNAKTQRLLALLLILPMWMNFLLRTYSWISILGNNGVINKILMYFGYEPVKLLFNNSSVILGMVYNFLPFMVLPIYTSLSKLDYSIIEAAKDLGADDKKVFWKVIFPLSIPGIVSGITMVFMPAVSTFVIPSLLGGGKNMLIGNVVEQQFRVVGDWNFGSAISVILMLFILLSVAVFRKYEEKA